MKNHDDDHVTRPELAAHVGQITEKIDGLRVETKNEFKWQRWVIVALAASVFAPKAGAPSPQQVAEIAFKALGSLS